MHLNTQSMVSTFNEFALTVKSYPLDIITLSETWLKNQKELLEYVSLPGYATEFRHREVAKGGGVGAYISAARISKIYNQNLNTYGLKSLGEINIANSYLGLCTAPIKC